LPARYRSIGVRECGYLRLDFSRSGCLDTIVRKNENIGRIASLPTLSCHYNALSGFLKHHLERIIKIQIDLTSYFLAEFVAFGKQVEKIRSNFKLVRPRHSSVKKGRISSEILISNLIEKTEASAMSPCYVSNTDISLLGEGKPPLPGA
jgi:hypothetical protein